MFDVGKSKMKFWVTKGGQKLHRLFFRKHRTFSVTDLHLILQCVLQFSLMKMLQLVCKLNLLRSSW